MAMRLRSTGGGVARTFQKRIACLSLGLRYPIFLHSKINPVRDNAGLLFNAQHFAGGACASGNFSLSAPDNVLDAPKK
jgi:hypothetical protein